MFQLNCQLLRTISVGLCHFYTFLSFRRNKLIKILQIFKDNFHIQRHKRLKDTYQNFFCRLCSYLCV